MDNNELTKQNKNLRINCKSFIDENQRLADGWHNSAIKLDIAIQALESLKGLKQQKMIEFLHDNKCYCSKDTNEFDCVQMIYEVTLTKIEELNK